MSKLRYLYLLLFVIPIGLNAQMEVLDATTPPITPIGLIENIFLGNGVEIIDIQHEGQDFAVGFFKDAEADIGIERGIIMSTGRAASAKDANNNIIAPFGADATGGVQASEPAAGGVSDVDINDIVGDPTLPQDMSKFTITFIPVSDTLRFRYVWGSEEYPEYTCSNFNDIFGFFISGPGIAGPYENGGENIALVPGTSLPVTINTVNGGMVGANGTLNNCSPPNGSLAFSQFYTDNDGSSNQPVYDGFTTVLTAEAIVIPCQEYTIKLIVADISDGAFDSGVFLEAKSFGTGSLDVTTRTVSLDETLAEGCSGGEVIFEVPNAPDADFPIDINLLGTAENGVDYELILNDLFIPAGDTSVSLGITTIADNITEGLESITFDVRINPCKRDTFTIFIKDNELENTLLPRDTTICVGDTVAYNAPSPTVIPAPLSFTNDVDLFVDPPLTALTSTISVSNVYPRILGPGVIGSICLNVEHVWIDDIDIFLVAPNGAFLELTTDNGANGDDYVNTCFTPLATTVISAPGPVAPASAAPFTGDWLPEGPWSDLWGGQTNGDWELIIRDDAMGFEGTLLDWTITFEQTYSIDYLWSPATDISCIDCPATTVYPADTMTYVLSTMDSYGCVILDSTIVNPVSELPAPIISCGDITNSSVSFVWDAVNGSTGYEVNVNGMGWTNPNVSDFEHNISGLGLGDTITIEVTGLFPCGAEVSTFECQTPICAAPDLNLVDIVDVACSGDSSGEITVAASGGLGGFVYSLGTETNATGIFGGLSAGTYEVSVIDAFPCAQTLTVEIEEPAAIVIGAQVNENISCNGANDGVATVVVTGGVGPYSYDWDGTQFDSIATGLSPGDHVLNFMDANGCDFSETVNISEPAPLTAAQDSMAVLCNGDSNGSATVVALGGTSPFDYLWDAMAANQMTQTATSLAPGIYSVSITDDSLCLYMTTVEVLEPEILASTISGTDPLCFDAEDGTAMVTPSGGTAGYEYSWNDPSSSITQTITGIDAGIYEVIITDSNGCEQMNSVVLNNPLPISLSASQTNVLCNGGNSGLISVAATDFVGTANYTWDNGPTVSMNTNLTAGEYCVVVDDDNNCESDTCITISEPLALSVDELITNAGCNGQTNGAIQISISGGVFPFDVVWTGGEMDSTISNLAAGDYTANIIDANLCTTTYTGTVSENAPFLIDLNEQSITCNGYADGQIITNTSGTNSTLVYQWTGPNGFTSTAQNLTDLDAGTYSVMIADSDSCVVSGDIVLEQPEPLDSDYLSEDVRCFDEENGIIIINVENGVGPYQYSIDDGENFQEQSVFSGLGQGTYGIVIQDANGCEKTDDVFIDQPIQLNINVDSIYRIFYGDVVQLNANINAPISSLDLFEWSPDTSLTCNDCFNPLASPEYTTTYTLTIRDTTGCVAEKSVRIEVNREPNVYVPNAFSPNEDGLNDLLTIYTDDRIIEEIESFIIFDRWGEQVYGVYDRLPGEAGDGWDGKLKGKELNPAVFTWMARIRLIDGKIEIYSGDITLLK